MEAIGSQGVKQPREFSHSPNNICCVHKQYMMDRKALLFVLLLAVAAADLHRGETVKFTIANVSKVNVEEEHRIIAGNLNGDLEVQCTKKGSRVIEGIHNNMILFIEQYRRKGEEEYVVVDQAGLVTIWDEDMEKQIATFDLNATVFGAAIREREQGVKQNRLAVNCEDGVVQFSLDTRTELLRNAFNETILAVIYTNTALLISTNESNVLVLADDGSLLKEIESPLGSIGLFSKHNHNEWSSRTEEVIAIVGGQGSTNTHLLHIDLAKGIDSNQSLGSTAVTSFNYCRGKMQKRKELGRKRAVEDLIILGISAVTLQVRGESSYFKNFEIAEGIVDVICYEDDLLILKGNNELQLEELNHGEHNGSRFAAFAGVFFLALILAVAAYQISKRKVEKREKSALNPVEYELQERIIEH